MFRSQGRGLELPCIYPEAKIIKRERRKKADLLMKKSPFIVLFSLCNSQAIISVKQEQRIYDYLTLVKGGGRFSLKYAPYYI